MVNRLIIPNPQFADSTGLPYANGKLYFFVTGTATPLNTYSDSALTTPNANPIILDSAGRSGSVFLQNLAYKVQLFDVNNVQIWSIDPVWSSDFSTVAQFAVNNGSPNGTVAGTAGTFGGLPSSVIWDATNNILYVCTTTGTSSTAVWTAVNAAAGAGVITIPGGRLTPTSGTPVLSADAISVGSVFYTPYYGNQVPIFSGAAFTMQTFAELGLSLNSGVQAANTIYDVFVFNNSGTPTIGTGPAWTNSAVGAGARGAGAGTTQLSMFQGILVNTVQISAKNGVSTFTVPANQATYVGSILTDAAGAGLVTCSLSYGQSRRWGVWNAYNRKPIQMRAGDGAASWTYVTNTWRASNNSGNNKVTIFCGLAEEFAKLYFQQSLEIGGNNNDTVLHRIGIGVNSTTAPSGVFGDNGGHTLNADQINTRHSAMAVHTVTPFLGQNDIQSIEITPNNGGFLSATFYGTSSFMELIGEYNG